MTKSFMAWRRVGAGLVLLVSSAMAQAGPDVIVGDLSGVSNYGVVGGIAAYAIGTDSCNIGSVPLQWQGGTNLHPVIGQNAYRIANGRFEQIGQAWLKHGFTALANSLCATCQNPGTGSLLGVNCSDPYGSGLNGSQSNLGPRSEVNAATGVFTFPFGNPGGVPANASAITRRLQIAVTDLGVAGATYLVEGQYITQDDAAAGNDNNNSSYRRATFGTSGSYGMTLQNATVRQKAAIEGWRDFDATVALSYVDIPNDGRFIVAFKSSTAPTAGYTRYCWAVYNMNSDRSGGSFTVNFPAGTSVQNAYFHDVPYHSGEPYDGTDWTFASAANGVTWQTAQTYFQNQNANALRWGTCYTFCVDATQAPTGSPSIGLFKPEPCPPPPTWSAVGNYAVRQGQPYDFVPPASWASINNGPSGDDSSIVATLPFSFIYYGQVLTQLRISTNGYLCMTGENGNVFSNVAIPNNAAPNAFIAGYWRDLHVQGSGTVTYGTAGTAPNRRFCVLWNTVQLYGNAGTSNTFELILDENGNTITSTIVSVTDHSCTRGVENPGGTAGVGTYNAAGSGAANTTWKYLPQITIPYSTNLTQVGTGAPNTQLGVDLLSPAAFSPVFCAVDVLPGPTSLGPLGTLDLAISPAFFLIGNASLNPADVTDYCGRWSFLVPTGPGGVTGVDLWIQAIVISAASPNGQFHISNPVHLVL